MMSEEQSEAAAKMRYQEVMWAECHIDVYAGDRCDELGRRSWHGGALGDMDGEGEIDDTVKLAACHFPPGTKIVVSAPCCPKCGDSSECTIDPGKLTLNSDSLKCDCGFDWGQWMREEYS